MGLLDNALDELLLAESGVARSCRKCFLSISDDRPAHAFLAENKLVARAHDGGRVQSAAQAAPQGYVGAKMEADGIRKTFTEFICKPASSLFVEMAKLGIVLQGIVFTRPQARWVELQGVTRAKLKDGFEKCLVSVVEDPMGEIVVHHRAVGSAWDFIALEQRFDF